MKLSLLAIWATFNFILPITTLTLVPAPAQAGFLSLGKDTGADVLNRSAKAFNEIAKKAMPAVVSISSIRTTEVKPIGPGDLERGGPAVLGIGSGVIIRPNGLILTNNHVVENSEKVTVTFGDEKRKFIAHIVGTDPKTDLALIELDEKQKNLPILGFGNSDLIKVGDWAIAIGSPFGLNRSMSFGIISAKSRGQMGLLDIEDFIQTDAAINPGSSGGPLLNSNGEVIGLNTAILSQSGQSAGVGFAIPTRIVQEVIAQIIDHGRVIRGWMGLSAQDLDSELATYFNVQNQHGALISQVMPASPAGRALIKPGDVITKFGEKAILTSSDLKTAVGKSQVGSNVTVELVSDGLTKKIDVRIQEAPNKKTAQLQLAGIAAQRKKEGPALGLTVQDTPSEVANYLHLGKNPGALVNAVKAGSSAFEAGLFPGDIILSANRVEVHRAKDFVQVTEKLKKNDIAVLYIMRGPTERVFLPLKMSS